MVNIKAIIQNVISPLIIKVKKLKKNQIILILKINNKYKNN